MSADPDERAASGTAPSARPPHVVLSAREALPVLEELPLRHPGAARVLVYAPADFPALVAAAEQGHRFLALREGFTEEDLSLALGRTQDTVRDAVGCAARLRRAATTRELWLERLADDVPDTRRPKVTVDIETRQLYADPLALPGIAPGDAFLGGFEGWDHAYSFLTYVVGTGSPRGVELAWPPFLRRRARRTLRRPRAALEGAEIALAPPGSGLPLCKPLTSLTTRGASFEVDEEREVVRPGTPLGTVELRLPGSAPISVAARVVALGPPHKRASSRCGITFDRTDLQTQTRIADALLPLVVPGVRVAKELPFDALWTLLRESGFIYPAKAAQLEPILPQVEQTLSTLLRDPGAVFRTLLHESGGQLQGHLSAVRAYRDTWLIQHLATRGEGAGRLTAARDLNLALSLYTEQVEAIRWIRVFFRPQKRWPDRTFGRFARLNVDRETCDLTTCGYFVAPPLTRRPVLPPGLTIEPGTREDEEVLTRHLSVTLPPMSLEAEDLRPGAFDLGEVSTQFAALGLERRRELWVARRRGRPVAFALLESSSPGLNFSELTSAVRLFTPRREDGDACRALARHARVRAHLQGRTRCIALDDGPMAANLEGAGFHHARDYACWTLHRSRFRRYHEFLRALYGSERHRADEDRA